MDQSARTRFLAGVHVGVLSVESGADRPPVAVPVWYDYAPPGAIVIHADGRGEKVRLLRQAGRASLCVQDERRTMARRSFAEPPPYDGS